MDAFEIANVIKDHANAGNLYHEFFRAERLSLGLYVLTVGQADPPNSHILKTRSTTWSGALA